MPSSTSRDSHGFMRILGFTLRFELACVDVHADPRFDEVADVLCGQHTRSALCVPLKSTGRVVAVVQALDKAAGMPAIMQCVNQLFYGLNLICLYIMRSSVSPIVNFLVVASALKAQCVIRSKDDRHRAKSLWREYPGVIVALRMRYQQTCLRTLL